jgi:hypothetical protein
MTRIVLIGVGKIVSSTSTFAIEASSLSWDSVLNRAAQKEEIPVGDISEMNIVRPARFNL